MQDVSTKGDPKKRGRPPKFTQQDIDDMKEMYLSTNASIADVARLYRTSETTVMKAVDGKLKAKILKGRL